MSLHVTEDQELNPITESLIREALDEGYKEEQRHRGKDEQSVFFPDPFSVALHTVRSLTMSFRRIPALANLESMTSLTDLRLDNNCIERIEGLEALRQLRWLDLSFNRIERIEGLDMLTALEDLSLYGNQIDSLDGIEGCMRLECLSLGANRLTQLEQVNQLRVLPRLKALTLSGNPVSETPHYRPYCVAFLPKLCYLDHQMVSATERQSARESGVPIEELQAVEEHERNEQEGSRKSSKHDKQCQEWARRGVLEAAKVEELLFRKNEHWKHLECIPQVQEARNPLHQKLQEHLEWFLGVAAHFHEEIEAELEQFTNAREALKHEVSEENKALLSHLRHEEKAAFRRVRESEDPDVAEISFLRQHVRDLETKLLKRELMLNEQIRAMLDTLETRVLEIKAAKMRDQATFFRTVEANVKEFHQHAELASEYVLTHVERTGELPFPVPAEETSLLLRHRETMRDLFQHCEDHFLTAIHEAEEAAEAFERRRCDERISSEHEQEVQRNRETLHEFLSIRKDCERAIDREVSRWHQQEDNFDENVLATRWRDLERRHQA